MTRVFKSFLLLGLALAITAPLSAGDKKDPGAKDAKAPVKDKQPAAKDGKGPAKDGQPADKGGKPGAKGGKPGAKGGKPGAKGGKPAKKDFNPADGILKNLSAAKLTEEQTAKARELGAEFAKKIGGVYTASRPTKEQAVAMKAAAAQAKKDGKDKKAAGEAIMAAANWTDEQKAARAEAGKLKGEFMASIMGLLTDDQKASLQKAKADAKKKGANSKGTGKVKGAGDKSKAGSDKVQKKGVDKTKQGGGDKVKKDAAQPKDKKSKDA